MKYQISINKTSTEDSFEEGEIGKTQDFGEIITLHVDKLESIPLEVALFLGAEVDELTVFENRIEWSTLESGEGYHATENLKALWKLGDCKLWSVTYYCYVTSVWSQEVTNKELTALGIAEA